MGGKVLIVDGDARGRARAADELERRGHQTTCAGDARAFARQLEHADGWDVVVGRAGFAGIDLVRAVKDVWPHAEVIVAASEQERATAVQLLASGAFAIVARPCDPAELGEVVGRALERRSLRQSEAHHRALRTLTGVSEKLPESIVRAFAEALQAETACLLVPAPADGRLTVAYMWGSDGQPAPAPAWLHDWLKGSEAPAVIGPAAPDGSAPPRAQRGPGLVYPLSCDERLVAVLTAHRERPSFGPGDLERATVLAAHARIALENERLLQHVTASDRLVSLGQLAASIAHEIRTPLTYVLENAGYVSEHLDRFAPAGAQPSRESVTFTQVRRAATDAVDGANRICDIIRDIGALASADESTRLPFDLKEAIRSAVRMSQAEMRGRAKVSLRLDGDTPVIGSAGRMSQVFVNLLVNAAQAIGECPAQEGRIVVVARRQGGRVLVEVSDNGPGIRPDMVQRVFEPFFTTKPAGQGTGLGLFLCRNIVRRHGGDLRVRSSAQHGTTFVVDLPADPSQPARPQQQAAAEPRPEVLN